jgi:GAF domain-containing protein
MGTLRRSTRNGKRPPAQRVETRQGAHPAVAKLAAALREHKEAVDQQGATAEILRIIASGSESTAPVFEAITRAGMRLLPGTRVALFIVRDGEQHYVSHSGIADEGRARIAALFPRPVDSTNVAGATILGKKTIHFPDIRVGADRHPLSVEIAEKVGYRALLSVPLLRGDECIGAITIGRVLPGPFTKRQIALIKTFADQAVIAIENVRLFNETKEALERQTATAEILHVMSRSQTDVQPVFDTIAENALKLCDASFSLVTRFDGELIHVAAIRNMQPEAADTIRKAFPAPPSSRGATSRCILNRAIVHIPDITQDPEYSPNGLARTANIRSILAVPMLREGRAVGAIAVSGTEPTTFPEHKVALLKTFADQAVIAIENVRLFNETKEALERETASGEVLRVISGTPADAQPVFDAIARSALRVFGVSHVAIALVEGNALRTKATVGTFDPRGEFEVPLDRSSTAGRAVLDGEAVNVEDTEAPDAPEFARKSGRLVGFRAIATAPMLREGRAIGSISVMRKQAGPLSDKQLELLKTFADQAVIAIENTRLFNETREALEQQTATAEILKVISSSPTDMQPVFDAIVKSAAGLFESFTAVITMREGNFLQRKARAGPNLLMSSAEQAELDKIYPLPIDPKISISARAIVECRAIEVLDTEAEPSDVAKTIGRLGKHRSVTAVPLVRESEAIGTIVLTRPEPGCKLSEKQLALVKTFAAQAVIAIENTRLFNELQTTNASLREALEQQTATGDILKVISRSTTDVQPVFETIIRNAVRLCDGTFGMLWQSDGKTMDVGADYNFSPESRAEFRRAFPHPLGKDTPAGQAILEKRVVNLPDIHETAYSAAVKDRARTLGYRSVLVVPMMRDEEPIGALAITRGITGVFADSHVALLKTFADQAVIAIENVRLFNETKESLEQQTAISEVLRVISSSPADVQPVLVAVAERAARICDAFDARIFLREGDALRHAAGFGQIPIGIEVGVAMPLTRGWVAGRAVLERRAIHIEDLLAVPREEYPFSHGLRDRVGHRTLLAVPLMREERALGVITLRRMELRPFTEKQMALLRTFADQAAIAIENVRLFNETREALEQQKASADVLGVISSSIADTTPVFEKILESCQRLFAGRNVGINVVGDDGKIYIGAYKGFGRTELEAHFPVPLSMESGSGAAIVQRQVVHYPDSDAADVPEYARRGGRIAGNKSVLFAPMLWEGRGIGAIFVGRPVAGPFSDKEIALLRTFADQAAIAIQNARLFREIQEKSAQLEVANKHKSDFLANMSHELRTPLNAIIGFSEALMERMFGELNDKQSDYLKDIHESGKHLLSLINDILDLSKIEAGRMDLEVSSFHLPTALSNAMTLIRERAQRHAIELGLDVDQRLGEFQADERKFKQIMLNLLSNAVKFTPDGGRVDVCAKKDTDKIEIAVTDTGIGIAAEDQAAVFEEFKQVGRDQMRKAEGTGLGLALTRRFVELHGGAIRLESTPGKGSTFTVSLPIRD